MIVKTVIYVKTILLISSVLLFIGCKKEEKKINWSASMSRPDFYISSGQHVFYFNKGELISTSETLTDIGDFGWAYPKAGRNNGKISIFPDSVAVYYCGLNDKGEMYEYEGGMSLSEKEIESLFKEGYSKEGQRQQFKNIITGMAPGGRICVWIDHVEIKRGIVNQQTKFRSYPAIVSGDSIEINNYLQHHPVDYSIWEKADPRYELDFGFCSEDGKSELIGGEILSKEGIRNTFGQYYTDNTEWGKPCNKKVDYEGYFYQQKDESYNSHKLQLPVDINLAWRHNDKNYDTRIVLPKDFSKKFTTSYINPKTGLENRYNRIVFGVEKDGEHCIIWLDGPDKQEKLLKFKGQPNIEDSDFVLYAKEIIYY